MAFPYALTSPPSHIHVPEMCLAVQLSSQTPGSHSVFAKQPSILSSQCSSKACTAPSLYPLKSSTISAGSSFSQAIDPAQPSRTTLNYRVPVIARIGNQGFLVGKTEAVTETIDGAANTLLENLNLAREINQFSQGVIHTSANYPHRSFFCNQSTQSLDDMIKFIRSGPDLDEQLTRAAKLHVGNCWEMAEIGMHCPAIGNRYVERFDILNGDHQFIVIGRDPSTDSTKVDRWNRDAVIADPWSDGYYPAFRYEDFLCNYINRTEITEYNAVQINSSIPIVEPLNENHTIELLYGNRF